MYAEGVYIWVVGVAPDPDTTSPPQADFLLSAQKAGQPQGASLQEGLRLLKGVGVRGDPDYPVKAGQPQGLSLHNKSSQV